MGRLEHMPTSTSGSGELRIAYIVSMATGLHSFVFREIRELVSHGVQVQIFPTKVGAGPYLPAKEWPTHQLTLRALVHAHLWLLVAWPRRYLEVLMEAARFRALVDFAISAPFARSVMSLRLNLIHCHFGDHKLSIGYLCGRLSQRPVTVTIHAYELYRNPNPKFFRHVLGHVQGIVTIAEYNRRILRDRWGVPSEKIRVIPLFADLPDELAKEDGDRIVILTVARRVEKKGHRTLLAALAKLPTDFESMLVGTGPLDVQALARSLGVADRVHVQDQLSDDALRAAYRSAAIFCLPSEASPDGDHEGIPVALMEAMAYGLPVVATRHAGIPELVETMLVDEGDPDGLARCLLTLGRQPHLRHRQGERNREIVSDRFSRDNVLLLEALFRGIVNATP